MSSLFDELSSNKRLCHNDLEGCIQKLSNELVIYKDANQSKTKEMYTKLITPAEYFQIKTLINKRSENTEYGTKLRGLLLVKLGLYKEINLAVTSAIAKGKSGYNPVIQVDNLPGNYTNEININNFDLSKIYSPTNFQAGGDITNITEFLNDPSFEIEKQTDNEKILSNMKMLYDFSAQLYNDDTALQLCSIMVDPIRFKDNIRRKFGGYDNKALHKEILEYFFHPVPTTPQDVNKLLDVTKLQDLYIFTSQKKPGEDKPENYINHPLTILKYEDCLLDSTLFKHLYNEVIGPEDDTFNNNSLFVFNFRLISNLNKIINNEDTDNYKRDKYYFTMMVNIMTELYNKCVKLNQFLKDESNRNVINGIYEEIMKEITPVNIYVKVNNMPQKQKDGTMKIVDVLNPRYVFDIKTGYVKGGTSTGAGGKSKFNPKNNTSFFKDLKLTYKNCPEKVGFVNGVLYNPAKAIQDLLDPINQSKEEKYNLGKINGFYLDNDEVIDDPNCCGLLLDKIDRGENTIIVGNGQSGSGKTASLVYLAYGDQQGILPTILNKLDDSYVKIEIRLADIYFNWDPNLKSVGNIVHKHYMVKPLKLKGVSNFTFKKVSGIWTISINDLVAVLEKQKGHDADINNEIDVRISEVKLMTGNLAKIINDLFNLREIEPTKNNPNSSRSHVLVNTEIYKQSDLLNPHSKIVICDLAGVEDEFTCNCEQLVNLLAIYRTRSDAYSHKDEIDHKLYFDNFTCFVQDDYRTENQSEYLQGKNDESGNLTVARSKIIYRLYKFVNQVNLQLILLSSVKSKVPTQKIHAQITNANLDTIIPSETDKFKSYDDIINNISTEYKCIKIGAENEIKSVLQGHMISTSGQNNLLNKTTFYSFYNLQPSDTIDTVFQKMFSLYNIYMRLYEFVYAVVMSQATPDVRWDAVKKIQQ